MSKRSNYIASYASYPLLWLIYLLSVLPMSMLYFLSNGIYFLLYRVFAYRVAVTRGNLKNAFPDKSDFERLEIERKFYRHLSDVVVETIKSFTITEKELKRRMVLLNPEVLAEFFNKKRKMIAVTGHFANWEWAAITLPFQSNYHPQGVYLPIKNHVFNHAMIKSRSRFGIDLLHAGKMKDEMELRKDKLSITGFIADQSPSNPDNGYWINFLNQETSVARGTEKYARLYNMAVAYGVIKKIKRGYYTLEYKVVAEEAELTKDSEITKIHTGILENLILNQPECWLWSHKRWKHKRK
ncbi:MAG: lipid A biosynthesis acyltransferase [Bacteroidia bacterium]